MFGRSVWFHEGRWNAYSPITTVDDQEEGLLCIEAIAGCSTGSQLALHCGSDLTVRDEGMGNNGDEHGKLFRLTIGIWAV